MEIMELFFEVFKQIDENTNAEQKRYIKMTVFNDLHDFHFSLGMWIRNNLFKKDNKIYQSFQQIGVICDDNLSTLIIQMYYLYLKSNDMT